MASASKKLMQKMIDDFNIVPETCSVRVSVVKNRTEPNRRVVIERYRAPIEQYTETLPRRWWQLKAVTRIRIRRSQPQTFNCRCSMVNI